MWNSAAGNTRVWLCKIKPATYRAIIDDVIANIKSEFDDYGVSEEVLGDLQSVSIYGEKKKCVSIQHLSSLPDVLSFRCSCISLL